MNKVWRSKSRVCGEITWPVPTLVNNRRRDGGRAQQGAGGNGKKPRNSVGCVELGDKVKGGGE